MLLLLLFTVGVLSQCSNPGQFVYLANGSCLPCPPNCLACLTTADDANHPCTACLPNYGFMPNPNPLSTAGGNCLACSTLGRVTSHSSTRLRLMTSSGKSF
jgi:hypothetical protein